MFLLLVLINGAFKYVINVYKGMVGERMLRRLRYELYSRVLRFPLSQFRRVSPGEIVQMINAEVEPLGGFIGDAFALPAFQGGTLLTILVFMFVQDPILGLAAIALYPVQIVVIPKLQRQVNQLGKAGCVRCAGWRIGSARRSQACATSAPTTPTQYERARFSYELGVIFDIRFAIYKKKFFIKFINNFIAQLGPFFFFSIGGYLVIMGDLTLGALVAVDRRAKGTLLAVEGAVRLLPDDDGRPHQVRAGGGAVRPACHAGRGAAERRAGADRAGRASCVR